MPLHVSSTTVLTIRRSKLCYTASGIVTPVGGRPVRLHVFIQSYLGVLVLVYLLCLSCFTNFDVLLTVQLSML